MTENPYAPPEEIDYSAFPNEDLNGWEPAPRGKRFLTFVVDHFFLLIFQAVGGFVFGVIYFSYIVATHGPAGVEERIADSAQLQLWINLVSILGVFVYYVFMEYFFQRTIGKFLIGTRVVDVKGGRPTFKQILGRSLSRFIPFEPLSLLSGTPVVGWHDSLSSTRVVLN